VVIRVVGVNEVELEDVVEELTTELLVESVVVRLEGFDEVELDDKVEFEVAVVEKLVEYE
jgi:hypothetical protein